MKTLNLKAVCPKCGLKKIKIYWCSGAEWSSQVCYKLNLFSKEHMHRRCEFCNYEWIEKCKGKD